MSAAKKRGGAARKRASGAKTRGSQVKKSAAKNRRRKHISCVACATAVKNTLRGKQRQWCDAADCDTVRSTWENARARHRKIDPATRGVLIPQKAVLARLVEQGWRCARTGTQLVRCGNRHATAHHHPASVSLDQIDPGVGYTEANVEIVAFQYNAAKGQLPRDEAETLILEMAEGIRQRLQHH
jgi:hypothetical protein